MVSGFDIQFICEPSDLHGLEPIGWNEVPASCDIRFSICQIHRREASKISRKIQIDRMADMQQWADSIKSVQKDERIRHAIVAANNHYAGFSPGTVNIFRTMLGLAEATWKETKDEKEQVRYPARDSNQRTLSDFLNWAMFWIFFRPSSLLQENFLIFS